MAKLSNQYWCDMMNRVHSGRTCLMQEANNLGITLEELIAMGDEVHKGKRKGNEREKEWAQTKRESGKRDKKMQPRKRKPATTSVPAPTSTPTPAPGIAATPAPEVPALEPTAASADPMEKLFQKKGEIQKELVTCATSLEVAEAILAIRQKTLSDAQSVLQKVQAAVQKAQTEVQKAQTEVQKAQTEVQKAQQELQLVEQKIKEKTIYLVDPWFTGELPKYGTFLSTVEMEGVKTQAVSEEYLPEETVDDVFLFNFVPDYKKARVFCGLVAKFELEETSYSLLVSDERVKELLKRYIGK